MNVYRMVALRGGRTKMGSGIMGSMVGTAAGARAVADRWVLR